LFDKADWDQDGRISWRDFLSLMGISWGYPWNGYPWNGHLMFNCFDLNVDQW
jgi:hypothetical protein